MVTKIYKIQSEIWVALSPRNLAAQNNTKFQCYFAHLRDFIVIVSGMEQDIVNRKMALHTTDTPA